MKSITKLLSTKTQRTQRDEGEEKCLSRENYRSFEDSGAKTTCRPDIIDDENDDEDES